MKWNVKRNWKYRQILVWLKEKKPASIISSIPNLNIRIADIVMIQWVRSTYFFKLIIFRVLLEEW